MNIVCLDLEGVLVPEIWIAVAEKTKIDELRLTTRDISDYDVLMKKRIGILAENRITLTDIQQVIGTLDPLPGALEFTEELRSLTQLIILSDTFTQFASPLMRKLGWPTLFCNTLLVDENRMITGYRLRQNDGKTKAVRALQSTGFRVVASGDSYNDLAMIRAADRGVLFTPPASIVEENPDIPVTENHAELLAALKGAMRDLDTE